MNYSFDLELLRCPVTGGSLQRMPDGELQQFRQAILAALLVNRDGKLVTQLPEAAMVCRDAGLMYPVLQGIPVLVPGEAIATGQVTGASKTNPEATHG